MSSPSPSPCSRSPRAASGRFIGVAGCALALAAFVACGASTPRGATPENLTAAKSAAPGGAALFKEHCASCHGDRGQGLASNPSIIGARALPEYPTETAGAGDPQMSNPGQVRTQRLTQVTGAAKRDPFRTATDVYRYVSTRMPLPSRHAGSLASDEYWEIVNFMMISHGASVPSGGIDEANASSVAVPH